VQPRRPLVAYSDATVSLVVASTREHWDAARRLIRSYLDSLDFDVSFQQPDAELAAVASKYGPPDGRFLLARAEGAYVGCVGLWRLEPGVCEMKRLWVEPEARGLGLGRALVEAVVAAARELDYDRMRLDNAHSQQEARNLYRELGVYEIPAYTHNPMEGVQFLELELD